MDDDSRTDHDALADDLETGAQAMQERTDELGEKISDVREDWERKQSDDAVPGAEPGGEAAGERPD